MLRRSPRSSPRPPEGRQQGQYRTGVFGSVCVSLAPVQGYSPVYGVACPYWSERSRTVVDGGAQYSKACEGASLPWVQIPPPPPCDVSGHRNDPEPTLSGFGVSGSSGSPWFAGGLIVAGRVEGEFAEQLAGGGVDDADLGVLDEQQDVGSGVGPADADVVELAAVAQGDGAGGADDVGADPVVGVAGAVAGVARQGRDRCGRRWL